MALGLRDIFFAIIIVCVVVLGLGMFMKEGEQFYGLDPDENTTEFFDTFNESLDDVGSSARNLQDKLEKEGSLNVGDILGTGLITLIKLPFSVGSGIINTISAIVHVVGVTLGIPDWLIGTAITSIIVLLTYIIISAIRGQRL